MELPLHEVTQLLHAWSEGEQGALESRGRGMVSPETVLRDWKLARSWLRRELTRESSDGG
jgi:hypothetical protein